MIITLGRQHGSNGREIARKLAEELGYSCYDKEIVDHAAGHSEFSKEIFDSYDEKRVSPYIISTPHFIGFHEGFQLNMQVASVQFDTIRAIADKDNCIIVGRCADYVLKDRKDCINVFIHANMEYRKERAIEIHDVKKNKAEQIVNKTDKVRANYYSFYSGQKWGLAQNYDISIDSSKLTTDQAVELIEAYIKLRSAE